MTEEHLRNSTSMNLQDRENTELQTPIENQYTFEPPPETPLPPVPPPAPPPKPAAPAPKQVPPSPPTKKKTNAEKTILGSSRTPLYGSSENRLSNIRLAISEIDGHILQPGQVFSFNGIVGRRTTTDGYKKAKILIKGKPADGIGGGICQLSSTLYNAVRLAGLVTLERHSHSKQVTYLPSGLDAAVSYGYYDYKFKNTKSYPIKIRAGIQGNYLYVNILKSK